MPALLMTMSQRPQAFSTCAASALTASGDATSHLTNTARRPAFSTFLMVSSAGCTSAMTMSAPSSASRCA
jgi:hypothetical protein